MKKRDRRIVLYCPDYQCKGHTRTDIIKLGWCNGEYEFYHCDRCGKDCTYEVNPATKVFGPKDKLTRTNEGFVCTGCLRPATNLLVGERPGF